MATVAKVTAVVDFDGRDLPRQAKQLGDQFGRTLGERSGRSFNQRFSNALRGMRVALSRLGRDVVRTSPTLTRLSNGFRNISNSILSSALPSLFKAAGAMDRVGDSFERGRQRIRGAVRGGFDRVSGSILQGMLPALIRAQPVIDGIGERFTKLRPALGQVGQAFRRFGNLMRESGSEAGNLDVSLKTLDREVRQKSTDVNNATGAFGRFRNVMRGNNGETRRFFKSWKEMPHGFRQATFYVALFASLGAEISGLGSAAGSSLVVVASALVALLPAIAVIAIGISGITGDLANIPAAARPAAEALRALAEPFRQIQQDVTGALFSGLETGISALATGLIPVLNAGLVLTAQTLNGVLATMLQFVNSAGFLETLAAVFVTIQPIILALLGAFGQLSVALGNIFVAALPTVQIFADNLNELFTRFAEWTASVEGQNSLAEFFENGRIIMDAVISLLGAASQVLNNLVTPDTVAKLVETLGNLEGFMPALETLLTAIAVADPIGLIALALNELGKALAPATPALMEIAQVINASLISAITTLAPYIGQLVAGFAPLAVILVKLAASILGAVLPALQPLITAIVALAPAVIPVVEQLGAMLLPVIMQLVPVIVDLVASLLPIIIQIFPVLLDLLVAIAPAITALTELLVFLIPIIGDMLGSAIETVIGIIGNFIPMIDGITTTLTGLIDFILGVFTGDWDRAWKGLTGIVSGQVNTTLGIVEGLVNTVVDLINNMIRNVNNISGAIGIPAIPLLGKANFGTVRFAAGGIVDRPMRGLVGEAGPEAIVPLNRPLGAVNPDVRGLSALLQGKSTTNYGGESRRSVTVSEGAIQIVGVRDGRNAANAGLDRLVALVGG